MSRSYRKLLVWQKSRALASEIYVITEKFPSAEKFGLLSQTRRAAVSVCANIAEGQGRLTKGEFKHFLGIARGSLLELETHLAIAQDLGFLDDRQFQAADEHCYAVLGLLNRLIASLQKESELKTDEPAEFSVVKL